MEPGKPPKRTSHPSRADRLAVELRANLKRRKDQARARQDADAPVPGRDDAAAPDDAPQEPGRPDLPKTDP